MWMGFGRWCHCIHHITASQHSPQHITSHHIASHTHTHLITSHPITSQHITSHHITSHLTDDIADQSTTHHTSHITSPNKPQMTSNIKHQTSHITTILWLSFKGVAKIRQYVIVCVSFAHAFLWFSSKRCNKQTTYDCLWQFCDYFLMVGLQTGA